MPFKKNVKLEVTNYVKAHLQADDYFQGYFWFISDLPLRRRLTDEFKVARYIYKLLEGLQVDNELLAAQCKIQILLYASIYEAVLHHVVLQDYAATEEVKALTTYQHKKPINISGDLRDKIQATYHPVGSISVYENQIRTVDERKIVFEDKAEAARQLGLIDQKIKDVICDVYSMRNAIHLHAELRRGTTYDLEGARKAFWYLQGFTSQIGKKMTLDGKTVRPPAAGTLQQRQPQTTGTSWLRKFFSWFNRK